MSTNDQLLDEQAVEDIEARLKVVYAKWQFVKRILDVDIPALCHTVKQLRVEHEGILKNMIEMNQIRALDKTAWRRVGETLGLTEEESSHTSHVLATLAGRMVKYEQLQSQLSQLQADLKERDSLLAIANKYSIEVRETITQLREENEKLREQIESEKRFDLVTDRTIKPEIYGAIKEASKEL